MDGLTDDKKMEPVTGITAFFALSSLRLTQTMAHGRGG